MQEPKDIKEEAVGNDEESATITANAKKRTAEEAPVAAERPRTRRAVKEEQMRLAEEEKRKEAEAKQKEAEENGLSVRRSHRDVNKIRLKGTAPTFYRRLQTLFFSPPSSKGFQKIGGTKLKLKRVHKFPPVYVIDNFLTASDLEYFDEKIESCAFQKSYVDNMQEQQQQQQQQQTQPGDDGEDKTSNTNNSNKKVKKSATIFDSLHRTSTFFGFKKLHDVKVSSLEQRIADLLGCWVHQIEALQLVRYLPGQFFGVHHDLGDLLENDEVTLPRKNLLAKRRLVTLFCYLNTLKKGQDGCTYFPKCGEGLRVKPVRGRAVLWSNIAASGMPDPRTIHAGEAVKGKDAVKYGLNVWICEE